MKHSIIKILIIIVFTIVAATNSNAQEIGIRGGDLSGGNIAFDAALLIGEFSRIHADVSFGEDIGIDLIWDFVYRPLVDESLYIYSGVGPYFLFTDPFTMGAAGEIGFEYRFESVPIALGIDWRPLYSITEETKFIPEGFGFNVRFILDYY
jgi:hypothetical protein